MLIPRNLVRARRPRGRQPSGVSLAEVVVVLAVLGIAGAAIGRIGVTQGEHYRDFASRMQTRSRLREGSALLAAELRGISPGAGDLYPGEMRNASVAFRSTVGAFALCEAALPGSSTIDVMDDGAGADSIIAGGVGDDAPSAGDSLWVYDSGTATAGGDDRWLRFVVHGMTRLRRFCSPVASPVERDIFRLEISPAIHGTTEPHAPVRLFRRVRYALYLSSDGLSYLGFSDCRPIVRNPPCTALQPVSGPYDDYIAADGGTRSGLWLTYLDRDGLPTTDPISVARIRVTLRATANGARRGAWNAVDSQTIALRNASR